MKTIGVSQFKQQCLSLLDQLEPEGLIVTKRGKPVARVIPYSGNDSDLIGSLSQKITIRGDISTTGIPWNATDAEFISPPGQKHPQLQNRLSGPLSLSARTARVHFGTHRANNRRMAWVSLGRNNAVPMKYMLRIEWLKDVYYPGT